MKRVDILSRAGRSLKQAKIRTLLTSLAIAVGAFTLTLSLAAGEGSRQYADNLINSNINPQSLIIAKDKNIFGEGEQGFNTGGLQEYNPNATVRNGAIYEQLTQADVDKIGQLEEIKEITPIYQISAKYITFQGNETKYTADINTYGVGTISNAVAGTLPETEHQIEDNEVVVPNGYLKTLGVDNPESMLGKKITIVLERTTYQPSQQEIQQAFASGGAEAVEALTQPQQKKLVYTIRAITKQAETALEANNALLFAASQTQAMSDFLNKGTPVYQKYLLATAVAYDGIDTEEVKNQLIDMGYTAQTAEDLQSLIFTIVNLLQGIVIGFAIIALIASVFGIINTQYISVLERTQQIGLMKALGMSGRDVSKLFRYEAAWIGGLGGTIGAGLAYGLGTSLNPWINEQLSLGEGNYLLIFMFVPIVILIVSLVLVAIAAGFLPARKAAKLDPIEALRTE